MAKIKKNVLSTDKGYWVRVPHPRKKRPNGWLTAVDGNTIFPLWVTDIGMGFSLNGSTAQSMKNRSFFPRSYQQPAVVIRGQCFDQENYRNLGEFIRDQQLAAIRSGKVMGLSIPAGGHSVAGRQRGRRDGYSAEGYVLTIETGARFGEFVPEYEFIFTVARNRAGVGGWDPHAGSAKSLRLKSWNEIFKTLNTGSGFVENPDDEWLRNIEDAANANRGSGQAH